MSTGGVAGRTYSSGRTAGKACSAAQVEQVGTGLDQEEGMPGEPVEQVGIELEQKGLSGEPAATAVKGKRRYRRESEERVL